MLGLADAQEAHLTGQPPLRPGAALRPVARAFDAGRDELHVQAVIAGIPQAGGRCSVCHTTTPPSCFGSRVAAVAARLAHCVE